MYATLACICEQKLERVQKRVQNLTIYSEYTLTHTHVHTPTNLILRSGMAI